MIIIIILINMTSINMHICVYMYMCIYIYIYIYTPWEHPASWLATAVFIGWSNSNFNDLHLIISLDFNKTRHVPNTQGV